MDPRKGTIVIYQDFIGAVRYVGPVGDIDDSPLYAGVELCEPAGHCDGSIDNIRYFRTHKGAPYGIFVPLDQIDKIVTPFEMLEKMTEQHVILSEMVEANQEMETLIDELKIENKDHKTMIKKLKNRISVLESLVDHNSRSTPKRNYKARKTSRVAKTRGTRKNSLDDFTYVNYHPTKGQIQSDIEHVARFGSDERDTIIEDSSDRTQLYSNESDSNSEAEVTFCNIPQRSPRTPPRSSPPSLQPAHSLALLIEKVSSEAKNKLKLKNSQSSERSTRSKRSEKSLVRSRSPTFRLRMSPEKKARLLEDQMHIPSLTLSPAIRPRSCPPPGSEGTPSPRIPVFPDLVQSSSCVAVYNQSLTPGPRLSQIYGASTLLTPPSDDRDIPQLIEYESPLPLLDGHSGASGVSVKDESDHQMAICEHNSKLVEHSQGWVLGDLFSFPHIESE